MKKLLMLLIAASFVFVGTNAMARKRACKAMMFIAGKKSSPWTYLGKVGGFLRNKKRLCKNKANAWVARSGAAFARSAVRKSNAVCGKRVKVEFNTEVSGKRNSRDGYRYFNHYGYSCTYVRPACYCPRGYTLRGRTCIRVIAKTVLASKCPLPRDLRVYPPYYNRGGRLYKVYRRTLVKKAECRNGYWKVR